MRAIVVYNTRYGKAEKIAKSLASGLKQTDISTDTANINDGNPDELSEFDLIAIGAPTEFLTASKPMKEFLEGLSDINLKGKYGFAFDTKLESRFSGSAAKFIEKSLKKNGLIILRPHASAIVYNQKQKERAEEPLLKKGMVELFESIGRELGDQLQRHQSRKVDAL